MVKSKKMITVTLFVEPKSLNRLLKELEILKSLDIENSYEFNPNLDFSEKTYSHWTQINVPVDEYLKFKYCIEKQKKRKNA